MSSQFAMDFKYGKGFQNGHYCVIEPDVIVGDNVKIGHHVMLKSGTRIGNNVVIADYCTTTGLCIIGNNVAIRTGSCISKSVIINDWAFIGAGIMSSHTKHVYHGRPNMEKQQLITRIGYGAVVGSRCNLMAGITIGEGVIVGYNSNVVKDLGARNHVYFGNPAKFYAWLGCENPWYIEIPDDYEPYEFSQEDLQKYLPHVVL